MILAFLIKMGSILSRLVPFLSKRDSLEELEQNLLEYFLSADNSIDPSKAFSSKIKQTGFNSLENLIGKKPDSISNTICREYYKIKFLYRDRVVFIDGETFRSGILFKLQSDNAYVLCEKVNSFRLACCNLIQKLLETSAFILSLVSRNNLELIIPPWLLPLVKVPIKNLQLEKEYFLQFILHTSKHGKKEHTGVNKGIHGENNSCYLDALLFSMFYLTSSFDQILTDKKDDSRYCSRTRRILRKYVVEPLRNDLYCSAENILKLRKHLSKLNDAIMGSFMDVEEFFYILLQEALENEGNFIEYEDEQGWGDLMHLMGIDENDMERVITVQRNLETSFAINDLKLKQVPRPVFILGMPRSERKLVNYEGVIPNLELKLTKILIQGKCKCGKTADWERITVDGTERLNICGKCLKSHKYRTGSIVSRRKMKLVSIICIRGAHFTAFNYSEEMNSWVYFDSMAGGYPEVKAVPGLETWLENLANNKSFLVNGFNEIEELPVFAERAVMDGHWCFYQPIKFKD